MHPWTDTNKWLSETSYKAYRKTADTKKDAKYDLEPFDSPNDALCARKTPIIRSTQTIRTFSEQEEDIELLMDLLEHFNDSLEQKDVDLDFSRSTHKSCCGHFI